jgi:hypothetical protein
MVASAAVAGSLIVVLDALIWPVNAHKLLVEHVDWVPPNFVLDDSANLIQNLLRPDP